MTDPQQLPPFKRSPAAAGTFAMAMLLLGACGASRATPVLAGVGLDMPASRSTAFSYKAIDGGMLSSQALVGRVSILGVLATYDVPSQMEARVLASVSRHHTPAINLAVLMRESPENKPLVDVFARSVGLACPIAIVEASNFTDESPLLGLRGIPSVLVLDRDGHEIWRHEGFINEHALETVLAAVEAKR